MHFKWNETSNVFVHLDIQCTLKAAMKIQRIFYRNQVQGMTFDWRDDALSDMDSIILICKCNVRTAKKIMSIYHQYVKGHTYREGVYECIEMPDPNNKIGAIKMFREASGYGLRESKDFVENYSPSSHLFLSVDVLANLTENGFKLNFIR